MNKLMGLFHLVVDVVLSLVLYPVLYTMNIVCLLYGDIKYGIDFKTEFVKLNKSYIGFIVDGFEIHKGRILGD